MGEKVVEGVCAWAENCDGRVEDFDGTLVGRREGAFDTILVVLTGLSVGSALEYIGPFVGLEEACIIVGKCFEGTGVEE